MEEEITRGDMTAVHENQEWHGEDGQGWTVQSLLAPEPKASEAGRMRS